MSTRRSTSTRVTFVPLKPSSSMRRASSAASSGEGTRAPPPPPLRRRPDRPPPPLPAPPRLDLDLDGDVAAQALGGGGSFLRRRSDLAFGERDAVVGEQVLALVLEEIHQASAGSRSRSQSTISPVVAPGVKIFSIPASASLGMSSFGMIPPPQITTSPAPLSRSRLTTRGNSVMCAPEGHESPTASASSWIVVSASCPGGWWRA